MENNTKKSGKAGYIITIIFLLLVIVILAVLFVFKEQIFKTGAQNTVCIPDTNALIQNTTVSNTSGNENVLAQERLINSVKGYWIASTNDLFLAIIDTTDTLGDVTTHFSLMGASGITYTTCTIDSTKIKCDDKIYTYAIQGNNLILSYDNVTRNFIPSNFYQVSKQSKNYYARMMGYTITETRLPDDAQITGNYTNNALLGTWELTTGNAQLIFSSEETDVVTVTKLNKTTNESVLNMPVGMNTKYIEFVDNSSTSEEIYTYQLTDNNTLILSDVNGKGIFEYKKIKDSETTKPSVVYNEQQLSNN